MPLFSSSSSRERIEVRVISSPIPYLLSVIISLLFEPTKNQRIDRVFKIWAFRYFGLLDIYCCFPVIRSLLPIIACCLKLSSPCRGRVLLFLFPLPVEGEDKGEGDFFNYPISPISYLLITLRASPLVSLADESRSRFSVSKSASLSDNRLFETPHTKP
jgi:hypothetical protein